MESTSWGVDSPDKVGFVPFGLVRFRERKGLLASRRQTTRGKHTDLFED